jgi:hypothetical protein
MRNHQEILLRDVAPHWDRDNEIEPVLVSFNTEEFSQRRGNKNRFVD